MSYKKIVVFWFAIILSFLMFACEPETKIIQEEVKQETGHVLNWNIMYMPRRFYPSMSLSDEEKQIVVNLYEGLTRMEDNTIVLGMASSIVPSEDFLSYTIELKTAQWSDGKQVTTDDFIYSWERDDNYIGNLNLLYYDTYIEAVTPISDTSFEIKLYHTNVKLLEQLSTVAFMPVRRDVIDLNKSIPSFISDVTNGPYYLKSYRLFGGITLTKNKHYYDFFEVKIDEINIQLNTDFSKVYQHYLNGTIDFVHNVDHMQLQNLMVNEDDFKILSKPGLYAIGINSDEEAFKDVRIRKLLSMAIDRLEINPFKDLVKDSAFYSVVDYNMIEQYVAEDQLEEPYYPVNKAYVDLDRINSIVVALGSGQLGELNGLKLLTRDTPNDIRIAKMLADGWKEYLGVEIEIDPKDRYDYAYALKNRTYDLILNNQYFQADNIRYTLKHFLKDAVINTTTFDSYTYDTLLLENANIPNERLYDVFRAATNEIDNSSKLIPLFRLYEPIIMNESIENWSRSYEGLFYFGRAYKTALDKEEIVDESREAE
ncbi:MAG: hypothetical protein JXR88_14680 [Clostridia bacterium]|nr:hypothetical protein [Clostridia bacterium]